MFARRNASLVLADVREESNAGDVACGPDVLRRAEPVVDLDPLLSYADIEVLEPETVDVRPPAGGDQQVRRLEGLVVLKLQPQRTVCPLDPRARAFRRISMPSSSNILARRSPASRVHPRQE